MKTNTCFHVIPYIFPHLSMATMTTFPGTSLIIKEINWVEKARKTSFGTMPSPNIPGSAIVLKKTFPSPTAEKVL